MQIVDPAVTREKFARELEQWKTHSPRSSRGWLLLHIDEQRPAVEIGFQRQVATSVGDGRLTVIPVAIRLDFQNYDLLPPSITFIDPITRAPTVPQVRALQKQLDGMRDVLIDVHPSTGQPFLCLPGIREYHSHPQHSGDDWLLHRSAGEGHLSIVCERIWETMIEPIVGFECSLQTLPTVPLQAQVNVSLTQGDPAEVRNLLARQRALAEATRAAMQVQASRQVASEIP